jgi:hypothetical protein
MVFLRRWPRWPRVRHEMPYSSPVGGGSAQPGTQMTYHTFSFVLFVFGACIRMIFIDIHSYVFCFGWYLYMIFTDIPIYIYISQRLGFAPELHHRGSHSHSIGKINKGTRKNLLPSSLRFGAKPRHLAYIYIYIHSYPIRPRLPHDYMFWCSNDTLFRQRQWVPYLVFWRLLWLYPRFSGCPPILADISVVGRILTFIPNPKWSKSLAFLYISPNSVATLRGSYGKC